MRFRNSQAISPGLLYDVWRTAVPPQLIFALQQNILNLMYVDRQDPVRVKSAG